MKNDVQQAVRGRRSMRWLKAVALAVPIILAACVITDSDELSTSVVIRFDEHGLSLVIRLDSPVWLPIDEDDAYYIMREQRMRHARGGSALWAITGSILNIPVLATASSASISTPGMWIVSQAEVWLE